SDVCSSDLAALQPALPVVTVRRYYLSVTSSSPHRNLHQRLISKTHRGLLPFHRFCAILASTNTCASIAWRNTDKSNDSFGECAFVSGSSTPVNKIFVSGYVSARSATNGIEPPRPVSMASIPQASVKACFISFAAP